MANEKVGGFTTDYGDYIKHGAEPVASMLPTMPVPPAPAPAPAPATAPAPAPATPASTAKP